MRVRILQLLLISSLMMLSGCTLPGAASPTPFTFPTPNLTHTAIFAATPTETEPPPTLVPLQPTASETPLLTIITSTPDGTAVTATPGPTLTPVPTSTDRRPNGPIITAAYLSTTPVIDGDISEWSTTLYNANNVLSYANSGWTGESDLSAEFYIGWDNNNLYLGVRRFDDTFVQVSTGRYMYRGDDVEIQLDMELEDDYNSTLVSSDDYQIGLSPGNFNNLAPEAYRWFPRSVEGALSSVVVDADKSSNGYILEAKIPWTVFGHTPSENERFGFALSLSDNDQSGVSTWQSMVSSVSTRRVGDPTTWGTLVLEASTAN